VFELVVAELGRRARTALPHPAEQPAVPVAAPQRKRRR